MRNLISDIWSERGAFLACVIIANALIILAATR